MARKVPLTKAALAAAIDNIRGAVSMMQAYIRTAPPSIKSGRQSVQVL